MCLLFFSIFQAYLHICSLPSFFFTMFVVLSLLSYEKELAEKDAKEAEEKWKKEIQDAKDDKEKSVAEHERLKTEFEEDQKEALEQAKREWEKAHEDELARYQKLLGDYNRLEQRYENIQEELQVHRNEALVASVSRTSTKSPRPSPPAGEADVKPVADDAEADVKPVVDDAETEDLSVKKRRIEQLEEEIANLKALNAKKVSDDGDAAMKSIRLQEVEQENAKLKDRLDRYHKAIASSTEFEAMIGATKNWNNANVEEAGESDMEVNNNRFNTAEASKIMLQQFQAMQSELERRREECVELKTMLSSGGCQTTRSEGGQGGDLESALR